MHVARIINGELKRRFIKTPKTSLTRPTTDSLKESVFNILLHKFEINFNNTCAVDLFAGSGAFGIESISLGSTKALFTDTNIKAVSCIKENIKTLKIENRAVVLQRNALNIDFKLFSKIFCEPCEKIIVFLDPPYAEKELLQKTVSNLLNIRELIKTPMFFVIETNTQTDLEKTFNCFVKTNNKRKVLFFEI